ncbi:cysteine dioxygenase family protein [Streptomyces tanashiensis]
MNDSLEPAVSLHVYFPGLTEMPMHESMHESLQAQCAPAAPQAVVA